MSAQFWDNVQDIFGNALPQAVVTVTNYPAGTAASIFSDPALTIPLANPFTLSDVTGGTGILTFWAANGQYKVLSTANGVAEPYLRVATLIDSGGSATVSRTATSVGGVLTLTYGGARQIIQVTLHENIGVVALSGFPATGWNILFEIIQPGLQSYTVAWPTTWFSSGGPKPVVTANPGSATAVVDLLTVIPGVTGNIYIGSAGQDQLSGF